MIIAHDSLRLAQLKDAIADHYSPETEREIERLERAIEQEGKECQQTQA